MQKTNLILTLTLLLFSISIYAEPYQGYSNVELRQKEKTYGNGDNCINRPRCPAKHNDIECFYHDSYLYVSFESPEGNATMTISDTMGNILSAISFSTLSPLTIPIVGTEEPLRIEIITYKGNGYEGWLIP